MGRVDEDQDQDHLSRCLLRLTSDLEAVVVGQMVVAARQVAAVEASASMMDASASVMEEASASVVMASVSAMVDVSASASVEASASAVEV